MQSVTMVCVCVKTCDDRSRSTTIDFREVLGENPPPPPQQQKNSLN